IAAAWKSKTISTFGGNPVSMAAVEATLDVMVREDVPTRSETVGARLRQRLEALAAEYEWIGEVRGRGLMLGLELVENAKSRAPSPRHAAAFLEASREEGVLVGLGGLYGNVVRIGPSMLITEAEVAEARDRLGRACRRVAGRWWSRPREWSRVRVAAAAGRPGPCPGAVRAGGHRGGQGGLPARGPARSARHRSQGARGRPRRPHLRGWLPARVLPGRALAGADVAADGARRGARPGGARRHADRDVSLAHHPRHRRGARAPRHPVQSAVRSGWPERAMVRGARLDPRADALGCGAGR